MKHNPLVGVWSLQSMVAHSDTGIELQPFGNDPLGQIIYTACGRMSALLSQRDRSAFASADRQQGTPQELRAAFESFDAYCGRYELDAQAGRVVHHVDQGAWPNVIGTELAREVRLEGDELWLTTAPLLAAGAQWTMQLRWRRLDPARPARAEPHHG